MLGLPNTPCMRPYSRFTPGNSVRIFFQSHSSSSASSMESEVTVPCPISALWMKSVTVSSVPTWTKALSLEDAAGERFLGAELEADQQAAGGGSARPQESAAVDILRRAHSRTSLDAEFRGEMDRAADGLIGPAAADVVAHGFVDIGVGGVGGLRQQRGRRHDLPRLAVAALRDVLLDPGLLDRVAAVGGEAFDGGDGLAGDVRNRRDAGADRLAVEVDGAGAAERHAAAELGAGHAQRVAQDPQQRHRRRDVHRLRFPV